MLTINAISTHAYAHAITIFSLLSLLFSSFSSLKSSVIFISQIYLGSKSTQELETKAYLFQSRNAVQIWAGLSFQTKSSGNTLAAAEETTAETINLKTKRIGRYLSVKDELKACTDRGAFI